MRTNIHIIPSVRSILLVLALWLCSGPEATAQCTGANDCDGDGIVNATDVDDDNDGITDSDEGFSIHIITQFEGGAAADQRDRNDGPDISIDMSKQVSCIYHIAITTEKGITNHYKVIKR